MKNLTKLWSLALLLTAAMFMVSCDEDEPTIDVDEDGLALADGYYFAVDGEDPTQNTRLQPETVEGEGNVAVEREGFFGNYVFLSAGAYNLVSVESREITSTLGGAMTEVAGEDLTGDEVTSGYSLAIMEEGGDQITISNDGFFKISYDETTTELIVMEVVNVSFIGAPSGWSDVNMDVVSSNPEDGFAFEVTDVEIRQNENYKLRINNGWKIIRSNEEGTGYIAFTNYGGAADALVPGGGDIPFSEEDGLYTISVELQNDGGAFVEFNKTGEAEEITFDPAEYQFGVIGSANANGFDADRNLHYTGETDGVHKWVGVVYFGENSVDDQGRRFKFRTNDDWAFNIGGTLPADGSEATLAVNGADIEAPAAGAYYITLSTADEGDTWISTMSATGWGVIGEGSPSASWDEDLDMTAEGFAEGVTTYTLTGDFSGEYKFRAGDSWDFNLGGDPTALSAGGDNLSVDADGTYTVTLTFDGENYTSSITAQ
ncbi:hypothetical protein [Marivirga harenae]|uniref:hypothetical protein n=1 Tax=Marivirga harenae TaxID=2010992 RepID=UPI0026DF1E07|nr:hypothetical protein [Marivirga harenae]WKV11127.1 hypothetical protein Q3Y49_12995 [Marivirga harenae]